MRLTSKTLVLFPFLVIGCGGTAGRPLPPIPEPGRQEPSVQAPSAHSWSFTYTPGVASYRVTRSATVESVSDPNPSREVTTNLTHETLTVERVGDTIQFTMVADTFATTTQNLVGPAQTSVVPIEIDGTMVHDTLRITDNTASAPCVPAQSAIVADVRNILVPFPAALEQGMVWTDSLEVSGCQAGIQTAARSLRSFRVSGEVSYDGQPAVVIERADIIHAHGEGAQQQHRLILEVNGTGTVLYYLSTTSGQILHANATQDLNLTITASGKSQSFKQNLKQEFALTR